MFISLKLVAERVFFWSNVYTALRGWGAKLSSVNCCWSWIIDQRVVQRNDESARRRGTSLEACRSFVPFQSSITEHSLLTAFKRIAAQTCSIIQLPTTTGVFGILVGRHYLERCPLRFGKAPELMACSILVWELGAVVISSRCGTF